MRTRLRFQLSAVAVAVGLILVGLSFATSGAAAADPGTVSGVVYQDFDGSGTVITGNSVASGIQNTLPVPGIHVTAYDAHNAVVGTATSGADGTYTIDTSVPDGTPLRIQFDDTQTGTLAAPFQSSFHGPNNGTSVQFVDAGATNVDYMVINPDNYGQQNAPVATIIQYAGDYTMYHTGCTWPEGQPGAVTTADAVVATPWGVAPNDGPPTATNFGNYIDRTTFADYCHVGSVGSTIFDSAQNALFVSSRLKRISDLGPEGLGGIYRFGDALAANGTLAPRADDAFTSFDLNGLPITNPAPGGPTTVSFGPPPTTPGLPAGCQDTDPTAATYCFSAANRGLGVPSKPLPDPLAFEWAGRAGIGSIGVSADGNWLFVVDLWDRNVYAVNISNPTAVPTSVTRVSLLITATQVPFALRVYQGRVYVGYVDTGDSAFNTPSPGRSAAAASMSMYVVSTPVASAEAGTPSWTPNLVAPLSYVKGNNASNWGGVAAGNYWCNGSPAPFPQVCQWNSWTDTWEWPVPGGTGTVGTNVAGTFGPIQIYPQPMLASLAFDTNGEMILGLEDRTSLQGGNRQEASCAPNCTLNPGVFWETISSGDILIAAPPNGGTGEYCLENNGTVGGSDGCSNTPARTAAALPGQPLAPGAQGPGGGEFFNDSQRLACVSTGPNCGTISGTLSINHYEATLGGVTTYPGVDGVVSTAMDPGSSIRVGGLMWFDLGDPGQPVKAYRHTDDTCELPSADCNDATTGSATNATFQKGGGLGAVTTLLLQAPVEIGNRVWLDADFNGRQDADEPNIEGAPVSLFAADAAGNPTGAAIATTTTDANGEYYFNSAKLDNPLFHPNGHYVVVFDKLPAGTPVHLTGPSADNPGFAGLTWGDLAFTTQHATDAAANNNSKPVPATGDAFVAVGGPAFNDHTIDAGLNATGTFSITKEINPAGGKPAPDQTFTFHVTAATDFRGDDVLDTINPSTFTVHPGQTITDTQRLPVGTTITLAEENTDATVTWSPSASQLITVNGGKPIAFTATDDLPITTTTTSTTTTSTTIPSTTTSTTLPPVVTTPAAPAPTVPTVLPVTGSRTSLPLTLGLLMVGAGIVGTLSTLRRPKGKYQRPRNYRFWRKQ